MAHVIQYTQFGGPEVLSLAEVDVAAPAAGEVAVRVSAVGVNPIDLKVRSGLRPSGPITAPRGVGADGAGTVTAVGVDVEGVRPGDDVVIVGASGTYASEIVLPAECVLPRPPRVSPAEGAAVGIPAATAYQSLRSLDVRAGETLLVHGGSGAVGQAAVQFAALWGARVLATASPRRFDRLRALGAVPIAYGDGLADRVRALAPQGVTVILDAAGTDEALQTSLQLLADRDRIATLVRGADAAGLGIHGYMGGSPQPLTARQRAWRAEAVPVALALMAAGRFSVQLGPSFPLAEAAEAHRVVQAGVDGKVTLLP
jgi:NADPH2:quinone reductase